MNGNFHNLTKEELLEYLKKFHRETGRVPQKRDLIGNPEYPSISHYVKTFGLFSTAIIEAGLRKTKRPRPTRSTKHCENCGESFEVFESNKSKRFCSTGCSSFFKIKNAQSEKSDSRSYRALAIFHYGASCERCGWDEWNMYQGKRGIKGLVFDPVVIEVHHCDENRENNHKDNLAVLCPNCHRLATVGITTYWREDGKLCWKDATLDEWNAELNQKKQRDLERQRIRMRVYRKEKDTCDSPPHGE